MTVESKEIGNSQVPAELLDTNKNTEESSAIKLIDKRREEVENLAIEENATHSQETLNKLLETDEPVKAEERKSEKVEEKKEEVLEDNDPVKRVMSKVQKRIDKEVAKRKTIEEQLEDTRRELADIRSKQNNTVVGNKDDKKSDEPTLEQISAYLKKVREDGNVDEEVRVLDYISERRAKAERKAAIEELDSRTKKVSDAQAKQLQDWNTLQNDYVVRDENGKIVADDDMNLSNQKGLLYRTAMSLYHDKELHESSYSDPDRVMGFRRAVADAFREIYQGGLNSKERLTVEESPKAKRKQVLVEPSSDGVEETVEVSPSRNLSDNDKVMEEILSRRKFQNARVPVRQ